MCCGCCGDGDRPRLAAATKRAAAAAASVLPVRISAGDALRVPDVVVVVAATAPLLLLETLPFVWGAAIEVAVVCVCVRRCDGGMFSNGAPPVAPLIGSRTSFMSLTTMVAVTSSDACFPLPKNSRFICTFLFLSFVCSPNVFLCRFFDFLFLRNIGDNGWWIDDTLC